MAIAIPSAAAIPVHPRIVRFPFMVRGIPDGGLPAVQRALNNR
jgi:hypothetical protein